MEFVRTEEQEMLARSASDLVSASAPLSEVRRLRDEGLSFDGGLWTQIVELGWTGIPFDETDDGLGLGSREMVVVFEALGRNLVPTPLLSTVCLGGGVLGAVAPTELRDGWLSRVVSGSAFVSLAWEEQTSHGHLASTVCSAQMDGEAFTLSGEKIGVLDAGEADVFVVLARTASSAGDNDGLTLFLVPADAAGLEIVPQQRIDSRSAGIIRLNQVQVPADAVLGDIGQAASVLEPVLDRATVALCAEMIGSMTTALEMTVAYLKERQQFGRPIGSFQVLQHRAADLFIALELAKTAVMAAATTADKSPDTLAQEASLAKAHCSEAFLLIAHEAIQMFGGIGMTDEHDIGFFLKRARVCEHLLRQPAWHRDRWASLHGY